MKENELICNYDVYLRKAKRVAKIMRGLIIVISIAFAVFMFATCNKTQGSFTKTEADSAKIVYGFLFLIFGPLVAYINYVINMTLVSVALDLKYIRNKLYKIDNVPLIAEFNNLEENSSDE